MKSWRPFALLVAASLTAALVSFAQGPQNQSSETTARKKGSTSSTSDSTGTTDPQPDKIPSKFGKQKQPGAEENPVFRTDAATVSVDVAVLDNQGRFIPKLPRDNFRILEDNVPQKVTGFSLGEASMTVAMVIEFSARFQTFYSETWRQTLEASYGFMQTLRKDDYLAVVAYDIKPEILSDFSADRRDAQEALSRLTFAGFSEANLFDALTFTAERMQDIEGRKAIVLISSGVDTFSKLTFDKARKELQNSGVPIFAIGMMQAIRDMAEARGGMGALARMDFLQADNQMRTFAKETGGMSFFPRFYSEFPSIFREVSNAMRNQYVLSYQPTNQARDGKYRKIKVELVNPETNEPLKVTVNGKAVKYSINAKPGYTAPREVE